MDEFGGFGGGDNDDDFSGGFGGDAPAVAAIEYASTRPGSFRAGTPSSSAPVQQPIKKKGRQGSSRAGLYAKSPQQRRQEEAAAREYQEMLEAEQAKQEGGGFAGFGDDDGGFGGGFEDAPGGAPAAKPNMWGQSSNSMGVVIPPFVPRDQRNAKVWDAGKIKKSVSDKTVLGGSHGDFLIRETMKGDRHVVCVNDNGGLFEMYIRHIADDRFMFMSREFEDLDGIVKHLQRNALYNKQGLPLYVDKPIAVR